jgi:hypothetical protein
MQWHARYVVLALVVAMAAAASILRSAWMDGYAAKSDTTRHATYKPRFQAKASLQNVAEAQGASQSRVLTRAEARQAGAVFRRPTPAKK